MLKSSSTPILGSLVSSLDHHHHHQSHEVHGNTHKHTPTPISCTNGNGVSSHEFRRTLFHSPSLAHQIDGFRRVQSDGNLEALTLANADDLSFSNKLGRRSSISCCTMRPIQASFEYNDDEEEEKEEEDEKLQDTFNAAMRVQEQVRNNDFVRFGGDEGKMYLATGLGGGNGGGGGSYRPVAFDRGGGMEEHYKKMLEENPGNSLLLRNYAHFLYKVKGDGRAAEEYYSRAILADEGEDGEILSQYAKLIWELHHDKDTAANYFQRAVEVSSDNSNIHAAYACFLWETEDEQENAAQATSSSLTAQPLFHHGFMASATA